MSTLSFVILEGCCRLKAGLSPNQQGRLRGSTPPYRSSRRSEYQTAGPTFLHDLHMMVQCQRRNLADTWMVHPRPCTTCWRRWHWGRNYQYIHLLRQLHPNVRLQGNVFRHVSANDAKRKYTLVMICYDDWEGLLLSQVTYSFLHVSSAPPQSIRAGREVATNEVSPATDWIQNLK